jgi:hypothetical protein
MESFVIFRHWRSVNSSVSSFQIVSKFFSPVIHMNLHLEEVSLDSSPWINHHHVWWMMCGSLLGLRTCAGYDPGPVPVDLLPS